MKRKKDEKGKSTRNPSFSLNRKSIMNSLNKQNEIFNNNKSNKVRNFKIKNTELGKTKLGDKSKKVLDNKKNNVSKSTNKNMKKKLINENKENNKKLINKKKLEKVRIESTIKITSNNKTEEIINHKLQIQETLEIKKAEKNFGISSKNENKKESKQIIDNLAIVKDKAESTNIINSSNYFNINVNINHSESYNKFEYKFISNLNINQTLNSNISKSDNNLSYLGKNNPKSRNSNLKFNLENFPTENFSKYWKFKHLANQRKSQLENKIMQEKINKLKSLPKNSIEESDSMESINEFDSEEKAHWDIPCSAINYASMPICGSKIIRRHSSFSKLLEKFNYKRFFNFRKSSYLSPIKLQHVKNNNDDKNDLLTNSTYNYNNKNIYNKCSMIKSINEEKNTPEIQDFNLKKIEVFDSENYCEINSSAPDLTISVSDVSNNNVFQCCDNIEIKDKVSFIDFNKQSHNDRKKKQKNTKNNPNRRKSRSVINLMIVNLNK
jgi:hypothetical protein